MKADLRYIASRCFETYPFPAVRSGELWSTVGEKASLVNDHRAAMLRSLGCGITSLYHRVNDESDSDLSVARLRELHVELDHAVRDAYGWNDLELDHHHWETPQGMRFTVGPAAKDELLDRLLELNHERYAAEVAAGLHDKKAKKAPAKKAGKTLDPGQESLL